MLVSEMQPSQFFAIQTNDIMDNTSTHFDLYACIDHLDKLSTDYLLYAKAPYNWTLRELSELTQLGVKTLYVKETQRSAFERFQKLNAPVPKIDPSLEPKFRLQSIQNVGQHLVEACFLSEVNANLVSEIRSLCGNIVTTLQQDKSAILQLQALCEHDLYTYVHSVGVSALTTAIAMQMGETRHSVLQEYAIGGLLHDLGKRKIPLLVLNKTGPLTTSEWEMMKQHPESGLQAVTAQDLGKIVTDIIGLHHEKLDGTGYPNGIGRSEIPQHVMISTAADIFNALTTSRSYHRKRNRFEALMFMRENLNGKVDADVFKALIACLTEAQKVA